MPARPATAKQLSYLRRLADSRGQTFTYPRTAADASREIDRLKSARPETVAERRRERAAIADAIQAGPAEQAARVRPDETVGYGSSATWTQNRSQEPVAPSAVPAPARSTPQVGQRLVLGRYVPADGAERVLIGQRVDGVVRVSDVPAVAGGRAYLIERGLETKAEMDALVTDYLRQARRLRAIPIATVEVEIRG